MSATATSSLPDYADIAAAMQRSGLSQGPAEVHGFALGLLLGGVQDAAELWQQELYSEFDPADVLAVECRDVLERIFTVVFNDGPLDTMVLTPLLPEDIRVDASRLSALRDWCQGFLFGFGLGGRGAGRGLSDQTREVIHDIAEIGRLDTDDVDNTDDNRAALIELEEYLRVGVLLIHDEAKLETTTDDPK
jgi:uncharacterized protein YgfB (UPF0149 family)